jgi:hypothetical protein
LDQLVLVGDRDTGLLWVLRDGVQDKDVANTSDFVLKSYIGKNGLFRAFFYGDGYWQASGDDLAYSDNGGRVACYSAEGASLVTAPEVVARESVAEKQKADFLGRIQKGS